MDPVGQLHRRRFRIHYYIFFLGDTGENVAEWLRLLTKNKPAFPRIKVIYPTAPLQPYTPLNGQVLVDKYNFIEMN